MRKACENLAADIPDVMITDKIEEILRSYAGNFGMNDRNMPLDQLKQMLGLNDEIINSSIRTNAELQVKNDLLLEAVIKEESFEPTEEETEEYLKRIAESVNASVEDIKTYFGMDYVLEEQKKEKAMNLIFDSAVAVAPAAEEKAEESAE